MTDTVLIAIIAGVPLILVALIEARGNRGDEHAAAADARQEARMTARFDTYMRDFVEALGSQAEASVNSAVFTARLDLALQQRDDARAGREFADCALLEVTLKLDAALAALALAAPILHGRRTSDRDGVV